MPSKKRTDIHVTLAVQAPANAKHPADAKRNGSAQEIGNGGELHQIADKTHPPLTTQTGAIVADDENSLRGGERGPTLLEDHILLEKIQHFDHERIPERIVHARGFGAHGIFTLTDPLKGHFPSCHFQ